MQIRNLIEFTVDMKSKNDEIIQIVNVYLSQIQSSEDKRTFLETLKEKINVALESDL